MFLSDFPGISVYVDQNRSSGGSLAELWLKNGDESVVSELYEKLMTLKETTHGTKIDNVYLKKDIPERFHMRTNRRMAPLLVTATEGFQIYVSRERTKKRYRGNHGYDHELKSMRGIFLAHGEAFKSAYYAKKPVKIIDTYSLLCNILGLTPNSNNGSFTRIKHILDEDLLVKLNANKAFDFETDLEEDDLMKIFMYGGVLFMVGLLFVSIVVPFVTIMTSVRATCHVPNSNLPNAKKTAQSILLGVDRKSD